MEALNIPRPAWMSEDLVLLEEQSRRFIADEFVPYLDRWHEAGMYDRDVWNKAGEAGLLCASIPEEYGGAGGTFAHEAVLIGAGTPASTLGRLLHNGIVAHYILNYGSEEQKKRWLPRLASGELVSAIAMTEPGTGSDLQGVKSTSAQGRQSLRHQRLEDLHHQWRHGELGHRRRKTDPTKGAKGISLVCVETDEVEGFRRGRMLDKIGRRRRHRRTFLRRRALPTSNLIGMEEGRASSSSCSNCRRSA